MAIINLTPHTINVHCPTGAVQTYPATGVVARVTSTSALAGHCDCVPCYRTSYGEVEGLPEPVEGTLYLVSGMVRAAVPTRTDVASPGDLVRNAEGQPVGCRGLVVN